VRFIAEGIALLVVAVFFALALAPGETQAHEEAHPAAGGLRERILEYGTQDTGADNLVTAIYLGYRAYDTLGETLVLLLAVSGVTYLMRNEQ
jgi:multicomponent Na+:H+ antiporter subunit B